jgi:nitrogen fixation/metabolism regulation signal transduction histidine kinase
MPPIPIQEIEIEEITRGLSHGVRKHIANILLANQIIEREAHECSDIQTLTTLITTEVHQLKKFITNFQQYIHLDQLNLQLINLKTFLNEYFHNHVPLPPNNIKLIKTIDEDLPEHLFDYKKMCTALTEILSNSYEAMPFGGEIQFAAWLLQKTPQEMITVIQITDTGVGIPENNLKFVKLAYFTTKIGHIGMGLAKVTKIIDVHRGKFSIANRAEQGTIAMISLPSSRV